MPAGRHSKYDKKYCEQVIEFGKEGMRPVEIECELGVPRKTMLSWADQSEEFSTALTRAKEHEQGWWERKGREGMVSDRFNAQVWKVSMQARFREDYTERKELTVDGNLSDRFARAKERLGDAGD